MQLLGMRSNREKEDSLLVGELTVTCVCKLFASN